MGCVMTPMPNHLSTRLSLPFHHIRVVGMKGKGSDVEQMRRMVRSVEMVRLSS